jgi:tetratricopeptide (TPR) repeat protein
VARGSVRLYYDWAWESAEKDFRRALQLNPGCARAHQLLSLCLMVRGRTKKGLEEIKRAHDYDPLSLSIQVSSGWRLYLTRDYKAASQAYVKTLELDPNYAPAHNHLGLAYEQLGLMRKALAEHQMASRLSEESVYAVSDFARALALGGDRSKALETLSELKATSKQRYVPPVDFALVYLGLGDVDQAFAWTEKALQERNTDVIALRLDPRFDPLRSDPRFRDILHRVNFPP